MACMGVALESVLEEVRSLLGDKVSWCIQSDLIKSGRVRDIQVRSGKGHTKGLHPNLCRARRACE